MSASLLAKVFPAQRVHEAPDAHDCNSRRVRRFPAVAGVYYTMALSLYPEALADGSYLSVIQPTGQGRQATAQQALPVRVIEYRVPGVDDTAPRYRLITSLLDAQAMPALELAALYHQRWQVEAVFDALKTHLRQGRRVLRSKTAELVRQELYGWVLAHYAVRWLLHEGAARSGQAGEELSFTRHVHLMRREQPRSGAFPPSAAQTS